MHADKEDLSIGLAPVLARSLARAPGHRLPAPNLRAGLNVKALNVINDRSKMSQMILFDKIDHEHARS